MGRLVRFGRLPEPKCEMKSFFGTAWMSFLDIKNNQIVFVFKHFLLGGIKTSQRVRLIHFIASADEVWFHCSQLALQTCQRLISQQILSSPIGRGRFPVQATQFFSTFISNGPLRSCSTRSCWVSGIQRDGSRRCITFQGPSRCTLCFLYVPPGAVAFFYACSSALIFLCFIIYMTV